MACCVKGLLLDEAQLADGQARQAEAIPQRPYTNANPPEIKQLLCHMSASGAQLRYKGAG